MSFRLPLRFKIMILVILILNSVLILAGVIIINHMQELEINQLGKNAMDIASSVAQIPAIAKNIGREGGINIIQPIADRVRKFTQTAFVVVMGMDGIRYSHPYKDRLGEHFVGGDELRVLKKGESYISQATGTLGPSIRAFVPIYRNSTQVGAVSVGILLKDIRKKIKTISNYILWALFFGDLVGVSGSILLANNVKNSIFGLEPRGIARLFQEKNAITDSIKEGIIAIDSKKKITLVNKGAKEIIDYDGDLHGKNIEQIIDNSRLPFVLESGQPEFNQEQSINGTIILTNRVPIKIEEEVVGAVASFNRRTEVQKLAEELTGVKKFANALRSQNHEFMNYLHTISGLIQLGEYDNALKIISKVSHQKQEITSFLIKKIKVNEIAGLLLGKFEQANELRVMLTFDPKTSLYELPNQEFKDSLITILGNLIENALESLNNVDIERKEIKLGIFENNQQLLIEVEDTGPGIDPEIQNKIFQRGFSTKKGESRGIGLDLVKNKVDFLGGDIELQSELGVGSKFIIRIPY